VSRSRETPILPRDTTRMPVRIPYSQLLFVTLRLLQKAQERDDRSLPKYDLRTETKTKGVVDWERIPARSFL
jgi:hypothetical protein